MEKLRRFLKVYWTEHGTPILRGTIVILVIIAITQGLNQIAIKQAENDNNYQNTGTNQVNNIENQNIAKENKEYTNLIYSFVNYCKNDQIDEAYDLLSENCKANLYPTVTEFKNLYYSKYFEKDKETKIEFESENTYKIIFYNDILESGRVEDRDNEYHYYQIEEEIIGTKININFNYNK